MATSVVSRRARRRDDDDDRRAPSADKYRSKRIDDDDDDDDEEESPRARRRRARDEDPEPRRSSRSRDRDDDDDDDDDDDEDDEPRSRRSRGLDDDEDEPRSSRRRRASRDDEDEDDEDEDDDLDDEDDEDEDDDDDDEPRSERKSSRGWDAFNKKRKKMGNFANELKVPDDEQVLIKFLDDDPFASFGQHWVETSNGRRSYICLEDKCPLCDRAGDSPKAVGAFNVLQLEEDSEPKLLVWACGPSIMSLLEKKAAARTGPLSKEYYAVSKGIAGGGKKGFTQYQVDVVRARDLREEWNIKPLSDAVLDKYADKAMTEDKYVRPSTRKELLAVVKDMLDEE